MHVHLTSFQRFVMLSLPGHAIYARTERVGCSDLSLSDNPCYGAGCSALLLPLTPELLLAAGGPVAINLCNYIPQLTVLPASCLRRRLPARRAIGTNAVGALQLRATSHRDYVRGQHKHGVKVTSEGTLVSRHCRPDGIPDQTS